MSLTPATEDNDILKDLGKFLQQLSLATEELSLRVGETLAGLLNVTLVSVLSSVTLLLLNANADTSLI